MQVACARPAAARYSPGCDCARSVGRPGHTCQTGPSADAAALALRAVPSVFVVHRTRSSRGSPRWESRRASQRCHHRPARHCAGRGEGSPAPTGEHLSPDSSKTLSIIFRSIPLKRIFAVPISTRFGTSFIAGAFATTVNASRSHAMKTQRFRPTFANSNAATRRPHSRFGAISARTGTNPSTGGPSRCPQWMMM
jgi:hypothetical protein